MRASSVKPLLRLEHELPPVVQAGQCVGLRQAAQTLELLRLRIEQGAQALNHGIHAACQRPQLGYLGLAHGDEAPLFQRPRLLDRGIQWLADHAQPQGGQRGTQHAHQRQQQARAHACDPQRVERVGRLAHQLERADRAPAVGDLRHAGIGLDRQHAGQPGGRGTALHCSLSLEHRLPGAGAQRDAAVMSGIELRSQHHLHQRGITVLLRQRQRQRLRVVAILQTQLRLQRVARGEQGGEHTGQKRQQHHGEHQQTYTADQRHDHTPSKPQYITGTPRHAP